MVVEINNFLSKAKVSQGM